MIASQQNVDSTSLGLLNASPTDVCRKLERVSLPVGQTIHRLDHPIEHVYFPTRGFVSLHRTTSACDQLEVAMVGSEGVLGWPVCAELNLSPYTVKVLVPGEAYRISLVAMREEIDHSPTWRRFVELQQAALLEAALIISACSGLHSVTQRCCRWLLTAQDYLESGTLPFTQELIATHLGVRRPSVSQVIAGLQDRGIAHRTQRGKISIVDQAGLEASACGCHRLLRRNRRRAIDVCEARESFRVRSAS